MTRDEALTAMGLPLDATEAQIKRRYRDLAHLAHPDKGGSNDAMATLTAVYYVARSSPVKRTQARKYIRRDTIADAAEIAAVFADAFEKPKVAAVLRQILVQLQSKG